MLFLPPAVIRSMYNAVDETAYIIQRAAEAVYSPEGQQEESETVTSYMRNAAMLWEGLTEKEWTLFGGENSP